MGSLAATVHGDINYSEKFFPFGLTIKQTLFLSPFILLGYLALTSVNTSLTNRILLATIAVSVGFYAVHDEYDQKLGDILLYLPRKKRQPIDNPNSLFVIKDVRDYVLVFPDKLTAVLQVTPADFFQKSNSDKESTIDGYCELVNSFTHHPVRLLTVTRRQEIGAYFSRFRQNVDERYSDYAEDLEGQFANLIRDREIYTREFYLCIDYCPISEYSSAVEELNKRVDACMRRLTQAGHTSERLTTGGMMSLVSRLVFG